MVLHKLFFRYAKMDCTFKLIHEHGHFDAFMYNLER